MKIKFILFFVLLCATVVTQAEIYRWVDDAGKIHIGTPPPPVEVDGDSEGDEEEIASKVAAPNRATRNATPVNKQPVALPDIKSIFPKRVAVPTKKPATAQTKTRKTLQLSTKLRPTAKTAKHARIRQKTLAKKLAVKTTPQKKSTKEATAKRAIKKKLKQAPIVKSVKKTAQPDRKSVATRTNDERNNEMCGIFTGYVQEYKEKARKCPASLCDLYEQSLARYKKRQKAYCG